MAFNRTGKINQIFGVNDPNTEQVFSYSGTSGVAGVDYYSELDLANNVIFVPTNTSFNVTFSQEVDADTIKVFTNDPNLDPVADVDDLNKSGTVRLTHIVNSQQGTGTNNEKGLKVLSKPLGITGGLTEAGSQDYIEMATQPTTTDNTTFTFAPVANLSSNTTYFFLLSTDDAKDAVDKSMSFTVGNGFVTDNSRSFITLSDFYTGFTATVEDVGLNSGETRGKLQVGDIVTLNNSSASAKIKKIDGTIITYQLELNNYQMNVAFSAQNPTTITKTAHNLQTGNRIVIYDEVSGTGVKLGKYNITRVNANEFTVDGLDTSGGLAGRLNYYSTFKKDDQITITKTDGTVVRKKLLADPTMKKLNLSSNNLNNLITEKKNSSGNPTSPKTARFIRNVVDNQLSYIPVEVNNNNKITSDGFSNNMILELTNSSNENIRFYVSSNSSPTHNTNPFNTSAPYVESTFPQDGRKFTPKLKVTSISRVGSLATVTTNHPHNLSNGNYIKIFGADQSNYNKTALVQTVLSSTTFTYDLGSISDSLALNASGNLKIQKSEDSGSTYSDMYNVIQVLFSQSMNTSTITVANNTHLISANGTSAIFGEGEDSASSTIQISYDGFTTLVNCSAVSANTGNSVFTVTPEKLLSGKSYKFRVKSSVADLGSTSMTYQYETVNPVATGFVSVDPITGQEIVYEDVEPPEIRKIYFTSSGTDGIAGKVLESNTISEISSPEDLDTVAVDLNSESLVIQFTEGMNIETVNVNTQNTDPIGSIQLSCDDFATVVQMSAQPIVSTTDEENDTFTLTPLTNLSANSKYDLKITRGVADDAPNKNFLVNENISSTRIMTLDTISGTFTAGETIKGTRTLYVRANTGTPSTGLTAGDEFTGLTSLAKGQVLDLTTNATPAITSIRYTEIPSDDGTIKSIFPGEICRVNTTVNFSVSNSTITTSAEGKIISFDSGNKKITYRQKSNSYIFLAGSAGANDRVYGISSGAKANTSESVGLTNTGFSTVTTSTLTANVYFRKTDDSIVSLSDASQTGIDIDSNVIVEFNQTMNVDSININSSDKIPTASHNIIISYDSSFANNVPLSGSFTRSNNDTTFEFKPLILNDALSLHLTQGDVLYAKVTQGIKTKGDTNLAAVLSYSNTATITTAETFNAIEAYVFGKDSTRYPLGTTGGVLKATDISRSGSIVFVYNETIDISTFAIGSGNEIQLSTSSDFTTGHVSSATLSQSGKYGNEIIIIPDSALSATTNYYVRAYTGGSGEGGKTQASIVTFGYFTTGS